MSKLYFDDSRQGDLIQGLIMFVIALSIILYYGNMKYDEGQQAIGIALDKAYNSGSDACNEKLIWNQRMFDNKECNYMLKGVCWQYKKEFQVNP